MTTTRSRTWSWIQEVLPFFAMLLISFFDMGALTIVKAAMNGGMNCFVYIVYQNTLATLIILPFFIIHILRKVRRPPLTFHILLRFFFLALLGSCISQVLMYVGVAYGSPTLESAIANLNPGITFVIVVIFRMETIDIKSSSSLAKLSGTIIAISGAMVFVLYKGPEILNAISSSDSWNLLLFSQESNWALGGVILMTGGTVHSLWNVLQSAASREYPDQLTVVFFYCLFGSIQCIIISLFLVRDPTDWVVKPGIGIVAVVCGAVFLTTFHTFVVIWCLSKKGPVFVVMFSPLTIVIASTFGVIFLGDSLHLGSVIGVVIVIGGFYTVMWGQAKEKKMMEADFPSVVESGSSDYMTPLLSSRNESNQNVSLL